MNKLLATTQYLYIYKRIYYTYIYILLLNILFIHTFDIKKSLLYILL